MHTLTDRQVEIILAGSLIRLWREQHAGTSSASVCRMPYLPWQSTARPWSIRCASAGPSRSIETTPPLQVSALLCPRSLALHPQLTVATRRRWVQCARLLRATYGRAYRVGYACGRACRVGYAWATWSRAEIAGPWAHVATSPHTARCPCTPAPSGRTHLSEG